MYAYIYLSRIVILSSSAHERGKIRWNDVNFDKKYNEVHLKSVCLVLAHLVSLYFLGRSVLPIEIGQCFTCKRISKQASGFWNNHLCRSSRYSGILCIFQNLKYTKLFCNFSLGVVNTDLFNHAKGLWFGGLVKFGSKYFKTPLQGAQTTLYCALEDKIECDLTTLVQ